MTTFITVIQKQIITAVMGVMLCFGIAFLSTPVVVQAQTASDLEAQIQQLMLLIEKLTLQSGEAMEGGGGTYFNENNVCEYVWTRTLNRGDIGDDVKRLQEFLNFDPVTRVAESGVGSPGNETRYYGRITADAVSRFQVKYRSDVLSPLGLVNPNGVFGSSTMAKVNSLCIVDQTESPNENLQATIDELIKQVESLGGDHDTPSGAELAGMSESELRAEINQLTALIAELSAENSDVVITVLDTDSEVGTRGGTQMAQFEIEFEVSAIDDDIYIYSDLSSEVGAMQPTINGAVPEGRLTVSLDATADEVDEFYEISEGETETFILSAVYQPEASGSYRMEIDHVPYVVGYAGGLVETVSVNDLKTDSIVVRLNDDNVEVGSCESDGVWYEQGTQRTTITVNGQTQTIADAYFVCDDSEWEIEGSLPTPTPGVSGYDLSDVDRINARTFEVTDSYGYTRYTIVMKDDSTHRLQRFFSMSDSRFEDLVRKLVTKVQWIHFMMQYTKR